MTELPTIPVPKGRLTEREARIAGHVSQRLIGLRAMRTKSEQGGFLQAAGASMTLTAQDLEAVVSLLIERDENFLAQLDIDIER